MSPPSRGPALGDESPSGYPRFDCYDLGDHTLKVTEASGKAHTHGADDGRVGWKRHAVKDGRAACGLRPRHGWGGDLFEDEMELCSRCAVKLGACKRCRGSGRVSVQCKGHTEGRPCPGCEGTGRREQAAAKPSSLLDLVTTEGGRLTIVKVSKLLATDSAGRTWSVRSGHEMGGAVPRHSCRTRVEARSQGQLDPDSSRRLREAAATRGEPTR